MRPALCLLAFFVLTAPSAADEIQTKDGKRIEFKSITDAGDVLEVTTPAGTKVTVKKADFERLVLSGVKEEPLTGATFTFDKKRKLEMVDLLSKIDIKRDTVTTEWKLAGGALTGRQTVDGTTKLQTTYTPPEEYDLTMVVEHKEGNGALHVGLIGGGRQFTFGLGTTASGLDLFEGRVLHDTGIAIPGRFFTKGARTIVFMVRKEALIVQADGKDYFTWKADWDKLSLRNGHAVPSKNVLFLSVYRSDYSQLTYAVSRMTVTAPKN